MLFAVLLAEDAICFSNDAVLEGDSQQLSLTAVLTPSMGDKENDVFCAASDGKDAELTIRFSQLIQNRGEFTTTFKYVYGVTNRVSIDLNEYDFNLADFMSIISVATAGYVIKMQKLGEQQGTFKQIMHTKQDVSGCWKTIDFRFGIKPGEEYFSFIFEPNMCQIPDNVKESIQLIAMTTVHSVPLNLQFQESDVSGGFSYPYNHQSVTQPRQYCRDYPDEQDQDNCLYFLSTVETDTDWQISAALRYDFMNIHTEIIGSINGVYEMFESVECAQASNLQADLREDKVLVSHLAFSGIPSCNQEMALTKTVTWVMQIIGSKSLRLQGQYSAEEYYNSRDLVYDSDNSEIFGPSVLIYFQSLFRDENGVVVGGFTIFQNAVMNCVQQTSLRVGTTSVEVEQRLYMNENCRNKGVESKILRVNLLDNKFNVLFSAQNIPQVVNYSAYINKLTIKCSEMPDPDECERSLKKAKKLGLSGKAFFELTSDIRQFGTKVYTDGDYIFYIMISCLVAVYLIAGAVILALHFVRQHTKE